MLFLQLTQGKRIKPADLFNWLLTNGYTREQNVSHSSLFSQHGDSILIWPVNLSLPVRIDFFGNSIEKIYLIDTSKQKKKALNFLKIWPNLIYFENNQVIPESYLVHPFHGIGIFKYIETKIQGENETRYIKIEYAKGDALYFPMERSKDLMIYIGSRRPRISRLNSDSWFRTRRRVEKKLLAFAKQLLEIHANRQITYRQPYPKDYSFLNILNQSFDYQLTADQNKSLKEIIKSLTENNHPQDHLLVGDVGYGKTEVALRSASIVLAAGKQVALLAPTTVLAAQHFSLIKQRFQDLPIIVEHLSRFNTKSHKEIITRINQGQVDMIVGTHKLLSENINFPNLGLLIIDEEQKFGVEQKEKLKKIRQSVDTLSLSATPIPRTLFMSLSGLRQMSLLNQAPLGRKGVDTKVGFFDQDLMLKLIRQEIDRNGQIYFIHNQVSSIPLVKNRLLKLLKDNWLKARTYQIGKKKKGNEVVVGVAHGQMHEQTLAETMSAFMAKQIDILIASTIVENGLDHPNANTLIVQNAECFGLADLYQLRGRVGRRNRKAFAYFMIGSLLKEQPQIKKKAQNRLAALADLESLGGGWQLSLKDLEIRGSGNLLGHEQHGHMEAIGLILYSKLLQEAINRLQKEELLRIKAAATKKRHLSSKA